MKNLLTCLFLFSFALLDAQDSISWNAVYQIPLPKQSNWTIDHFEQVYYADKDQLKKFDVKGKLYFEQSLKRYGKINEIDAKNPMKVMLFSEQQQIIVYVDNTLNIQNEIDLSDFELNYVTHVASSIQPDKFWVYDQENSRLNLIASKIGQSVRIENTAGLLDFTTITSIVEQNESLYVIDQQKGIFQFDLFGTLVSQLEKSNFLWIELDGSYAYLLREKTLEIINLQTLNERVIPLPLESVSKFKISQKAIFLESNGTIFKYILELF